jgi:hypothetical protein
VPAIFAVLVASADPLAPAVPLALTVPEVLAVPEALTKQKNISHSVSSK